MNIGNDQPFFLIAGPCQIESREHALMMATATKKLSDQMGKELFNKSSFDKANRTACTANVVLDWSKAWRYLTT